MTTEPLIGLETDIDHLEVGRLWACVNCGTAVLARREDLRNCRVCALMAQMQMAMPRG